MEQLQQPNKKLLKKYDQDQSFHEQMERQQEKYLQMAAEAYHSDLTCINEDILVRFDMANHQVYFFYACLYDSSTVNVHKLALFFVQNFNPKPKKQYSFVFFNQNARVDIYGQVKSIFLQLSFQHFKLLKNFILLRPSFYHKAQDFIAYNYMPSFLKSKTVHVNSGKDLCKLLDIDPQLFVDFVPTFIQEQQFPKLKPRKLDLVDRRINFQGQIMNEEQRESKQNFQKDMKAFLFVKPGKEVYSIQDYQLSNLGIPVILQMLVFYFKTHPEGLLLQGLFRKSVSIDEQMQTLAEIANKNYDYLLELTNPHIVANLIKRFFANLKTPVIPYQQFQKLMHDQGVKDKRQYTKDLIGSIPEINFLSLMYALGFFNECVIPNQPSNKMTAQNIAICLAPCLMRAKQSGPADLIYASKCMVVVKLLLSEFEYIFGDNQVREQKMRVSERQMIQSFCKQVNQSIMNEKKQKQIKSHNKMDLLDPKKERERDRSNQSRKSNVSKSSNISGKSSNSKNVGSSGIREKISSKISKVHDKVLQKCGKCGKEEKQQHLHEVQITQSHEPQRHNRRQQLPQERMKSEQDKPEQKIGYQKLPAMDNIDKYRKTSKLNTKSLEKNQQAQISQKQRMTTDIKYIRMPHPPPRKN